MTTYRYDNVTCSQCGKDLGPGDHGVSYCSAHGGPGKVDTAAMRQNEVDRRAAERAAALQADTSGAHRQRKAAEDRASLAEQQRDKAVAERDDLRAALVQATEALSGGLWDYGPGQDEHTKCNEVIAECRAVLSKTGGAA